MWLRVYIWFIFKLCVCLSPFPSSLLLSFSHVGDGSRLLTDTILVMLYSLDETRDGTQEATSEARANAIHARNVRARTHLLDAPPSAESV